MSGSIIGLWQRGGRGGAGTGAVGRGVEARVGVGAAGGEQARVGGEVVDLWLSLALPEAAK